MGGYRPRSPRTVINVRCRLNFDGAWTDACIHNVSSRGLMLATDRPPRIGSYVDIRRGTLIVIGRVIWRNGHQFGVRTQDEVSASAFVNEPVLRKRPSADKFATDRRTPTRVESERLVAVRAERGRRLASSFQFVCLVTFGLGLAAFAATLVLQALSKPLSVVTNALGGAGG